MDKIVLKTEDIEFLLKWRDEHKDLVRIGAAPMKAIKIECVDSGFVITCIRDLREIRFTINQKGKSIGNLVFEMLGNGMCSLKRNKTKLGEEDVQAVLTVYCSAMALLVFGRDTIDSHGVGLANKTASAHKPTKKPKKNKRNGITYILGRKGNEPTMMAKGSHSSPTGAFSVRGHYRHYKSGKVIWIAEYTKGNGKMNSKTYKIWEPD